MAVNLTRAERILARHVLQMIMEDTRLLRDAVEPTTGMLAVSREKFNLNLDTLIKTLEKLKK